MQDTVFKCPALERTGLSLKGPSMDDGSGSDPAASALRGRAYACLVGGDLAEAERLFNQAGALEPGNHADANGLGIVMAGRGDWGAAFENFKQAYTRKYDAPEICNNFVVACLESRRLVPAVRVLKRRPSRLSYPLATRVLWAFVNREMSRPSSKLEEERRWYGRLAALVGRPFRRHDFADFLFVNTFHPVTPWRDRILARYSDNDIGQWVHLSGLEHLEGAVAGGRGVVLLGSHFVGQRIAMLRLARMGYPLHVLESQRRYENLGVEGSRSIRVIQLDTDGRFYLRAVYLAQTALRAGGLLVTMGDAYFGSTSLPVDFLGRERTFRTGFAELALGAGSPVVPVFPSIHRSGQIRVDILPPLDPGPAAMDHRQRVEGLVGQYAGLLAHRWKSDPANVSWNSFREYYHRARDLPSQGLPRFTT